MYARKRTTCAPSPSKEDRYFGFEPGQYFLFDFEIDGETHSRCYSISSSAAARALIITVKRVDGGKVSNWLHDHLVPGTMPVEAVSASAKKAR